MEICRLCLDLLSEKTFFKLSDPYKCIINNVIPEVDLDLTINPVICNKCSSSIDELNKFKLLCYESQQQLKQKCPLANRSKLSVNEILCNINITNNTKERICRTCLKPIDCESFTVLTPSSPDAYLDSMLAMCLPEMDLEISRDPVMCENCFTILQKLHHLKTVCLDIEDKLKSYCFKHNFNSKNSVNLQNVLDSMHELCTSNSEPEFSLDNVKTEAVDQLMFEESTDVNLHLDTGLKTEEMDLKMEEFLIKAGLNLSRNNQSFKSFQDDDLNAADIRCDVCGKFFSTLWNMQRHKLNHTGEKPFECDYCHSRYSQKAILEKHIRSRHTGERPFKCDLCPKTFTAKSNLNNHYKIHKGIRPYTCGICGHTFSQKSNLKKHILGHSEPVKIKEFECEVCHKMYATKYNLQSHMEIHNGEKPYECELCGERFRHTMNLKVHRMMHLGKNPYTCSICGMQFLHQSGLNSHEKTHLGDKPFDCPICGKKFVKESIVASHMTLHTGEKQFECFLCKRKYADKSKLNYHLKKKCLKGISLSVSVR